MLVEAVNGEDEGGNNVEGLDEIVVADDDDAAVVVVVDVVADDDGGCCLFCKAFVTASLSFFS